MSVDRKGEGGVRHECGGPFERRLRIDARRCPMRYRESKPEDLGRARAEVAAWRRQHPQGTAEQLVDEVGVGFHKDYGPVLRAVLFAFDSHEAKVTTGVAEAAR